MLGQWLKAGAFVSFVFAGYFKASIESPVDLTLLFGVIVSIWCLMTLIRNLDRVPTSLFFAVGVFVVLVIPLLWSPLDSFYATDKVLRMSTLTLLALTAPILLFRRQSDREVCLRAFMFFGVIMALSALLGGGTASDYEGAQTVAFEGNTIQLARATGLSSLIAVVLMVRKEMGLRFGLPIIAVCVHAMLASGSRGPLLALGLALLVALVMSRSFKYQAARRFALTGIVASVIVFAFTAAPPLAQDRITRVVQGNFGGSESLRLEIYAKAVELASSNPQGIGWGEFPSVARGVEYPHNLLLEVLVEAGWIPTMIFVAWILLALRSSRGHQILFVSLVFLLLNAMVSGDINDNRLLLAFFGLTLATHGYPSPTKASRQAMGAVRPAMVGSGSFSETDIPET